MEESQGRQYRFEHARGGSFTINPPLMNEPLKLLGSIWPRSMPFTELAEKAVAGIGEAGLLSETEGADETLLAKLFLKLHAANLLELHSFEPPHARPHGPKSLASPLVRLKLKDTSLIPNLRQFSERNTRSKGLKKFDHIW